MWIWTDFWQLLDVRIRRIFSQWQKHIYQKTFIWRNTFSLLRLKKKISYSCVFDFLSFIQVFMAYDHVGLYNTICLFHIFLVVHSILDGKDWLFVDTAVYVWVDTNYSLLCLGGAIPTVFSRVRIWKYANRMLTQLWKINLTTFLTY